MNLFHAASLFILLQSLIPKREEKRQTASLMSFAFLWCLTRVFLTLQSRLTKKLWTKVSFGFFQWRRQLIFNVHVSLLLINLAWDSLSLLSHLLFRKSVFSFHSLSPLAQLWIHRKVAVKTLEVTHRRVYDMSSDKDKATQTLLQIILNPHPRCMTFGWLGLQNKLRYPYVSMFIYKLQHQWEDWNVNWISLKGCLTQSVFITVFW